MRHFQARVDDDLFEWFDSNFPSSGAKQWFIESSLRKFRELVEAGVIEPPVNIPEVVVREAFSHL